MNVAVNKKDSAVTRQPSHNDTLARATNILKMLEEKRIDFTTFSAKIKVDYEDSKGKQPDFNAFVRLYKDSILWVSVNATFLNIEAFRILITRDSITIVNKLDKEYEIHPLQYLSDLTNIPMNFQTMQDLIIGNPVFVGDSIVSYRETESRILVSTIDEFFKNLLTISSDKKVIERCKLDDLDVSRNRTADFTYYDYEQSDNILFATSREITVAEKTKIDINMSYKQFEFNKELSFRFIIPQNYNLK